MRPHTEERSKTSKTYVFLVLNSRRPKNMREQMDEIMDETIDSLNKKKNKIGMDPNKTNEVKHDNPSINGLKLYWFTPLKEMSSSGVSIK